MDPEQPDQGNLSEWRSMLLGTNRFSRFGRSLLGVLPRSPRCELCASPFKGPFAPALGLLGKRPFAKNPRYCGTCIGGLVKHKGGADVPITSLFADVRGSTPLGERLGPKGMHDLIDRFYASGVDVLIAGGAIVDRFMGDQVVGYFVPGFAGAEHPRRAIESGLALLRATGNIGQAEPWVPIGVGIHSGTAYVGTVGRADTILELTAQGEDVVVAARLASLAAAGEVLVSETAYAASGLDLPSERRELQLKGVSATVAVRALRSV